MYCLIDDGNRTLLRHITEDAYLLLPLSKKLMYQLEGEEDRNFVAGDGEPTDGIDNTGSFDDNNMEPDQGMGDEQIFDR